MLGGSVPGLLASSGDNTAAAASAHEGGGGGNGNGELGVGGVIVSNSAISLFGDELQDKGDRSSGGNRWPRQETLALLKIRSDMDVVFRDSSLKGPLWDDVSRKMAELGFHRSAKKCKEKFENVYKYHKRTKDGRATKQDGKSYRFFDQLEALDHHHSSLLPSLLPPPPPPPTTPKPQVPPAVVASTTMAAMPVGSSHPLPTIISHVTVPSTTNPTVAASMSLISTSLPPITNPTISFPPAAAIPITQSSILSSLPNMHANLMSNYTSSSSTSSDEQFQGRNKKKRKWKEFFERLMNEVVEKQEKLQKRFLEAIEKREHDRMVREESWKMQEMARMNREHEILVQERSMAAAKDAAVIAFLQKISEQQTPTTVQAQPTPVPAQAQIVLNENTSSLMSRQPPKHQPQPQQQQQQQQQTPPPLPLPPPQAKVIKDIVKFDNGGNIPSPSRWPKAEVQALINLRTSLDLKYQENGPKGPLWEDISSGMSKIGYNRSAKRCKEKWENINKYFKKVKESNKRRPEDSKTCPYFHLLDALYKEKNKYDPTSLTPPSYGLATVKPDDQNPMAALPLMVQPEQQWPLQQDQPQQQRRHLEEDGDENENMGQNQGGGEEEEEEDGDEDDDLDDDDDEDDEGGGGYEIVSNKPANYNTVSNVE